MDLTYMPRWSLYLALLAFTFAVQASSNCDATTQCLEDVAEYEHGEDLEDSSVHEHDVVLLQVDVQLQLQAKTLRTEGISQSKKQSGVQTQLLQALTMAQTQSSGTTIQQAADLRMSLAMHNASHLRSAGKPLIITVTFILILCLLYAWRRYSATPDKQSALDTPDVASSVKEKALLACYFVVFMDAFGFTIFAPFIPLIRQKFGFTATTIASLLMVFSLAQAVSTPMLGFFSDTIGRRPVILFALAGEIVAYITLSYAESYAVLLVCYAVAGVCSGTIGVATAYVADVTTEEERPVCLSYISGSVGLGVVLGPAAGAFLSTLGLSTALRSCATLSALNLLFACYNMADTRDSRTNCSSKDSSDSGNSVGRPTIPRLAWFLFLQAAIAELGVAAWESCGALYINESFFGFDAKASTQFYALIMVLNGLVIVVTTVFIYPALSPLAGQVGTFNLGTSLKVSATIGYAVAPTKWSFLVLTLISTLGENLIGPGVGALMTEIADPSSFGTCLGVSATFAAISRVGGPLLFAHLYDTVSHSSIFLVVAATSATSGMIWTGVYYRKPGLLSMKEVEENAETLMQNIPVAKLTHSISSSDVYSPSMRKPRMADGPIRSASAADVPIGQPSTQKDASLPPKAETFG